MARLPRVVVADVAHNVTQRGNVWKFLPATAGGAYIAVNVWSARKVWLIL